MKKTFYLLVVTALLLVSCSVFTLVQEDGDPVPTTATVTETAGVLPTAQAPAGATPPALSVDMLANADYHSVTLAADQANFRLENGVYYLPHRPEEADSAYYMSLTERAAFGDLNADGIEDAAVVLHGQNGGTGHYINELAAVLNQNGAPQNVATVSLGDRVMVNAIEIVEGEIVVELVSDETGTGAPEERRLVYRLEGAELVSVNP